MRFCKIVLLFLGCLAVSLAPVYLTGTTVFEGGETYTFYLNSKSSSAQMVRVDGAESWKKLFLTDCVGESATYSGQCAQEILSRYRAEVRFTEQVGDVMSYYCYSPMLGEGIALCGSEINLHVAESAAQTVAGTPVIFGGY